MFIYVFLSVFSSVMRSYYEVLNTYKHLCSWKCMHLSK